MSYDIAISGASGALNNIGGGKWRCLVTGCNVGCENYDDVARAALETGAFL